MIFTDQIQVCNSISFILFFICSIVVVVVCFVSGSYSP